MRFEDELKKGSFIVGRCPKCHITVWPPSDFCTKCFEKLEYGPITQPGVLIEWSSKEGKVFGIVEFEDTVRVIGALVGSSSFNVGQKMIIQECSYQNSPKLLFCPDSS